MYSKEKVVALVVNLDSPQCCNSTKFEHSIKNISGLAINIIPHRLDTVSKMDEWGYNDKELQKVFYRNF